VHINKSHINKSIVKLAIIIAIAIVLSTMPFVLNKYLTSVIIMMFILILSTMSLRVSLTVGHINIAVFGFFAIGSYTSAILTMKLGLPFLFSFLCGGGVAAIVALILGSIIVNLSEAYFLIITWGFLELVRTIIVQLTPITGGPFGIVQIPPISIGAITLTGVSEYFFILSVSVLILVILYRIEKSRLGLTWKSIAQSPRLSEAVGINNYKFRLISFMISSAVAGLSGALYAHHMGSLSPMVFSFALAIQIVIYNFFGGMKHFIGPIIGAVILMMATEPLRGLQTYEILVYAIVVILVCSFLPDGLISLPDKLIPLIRNLRKSGRTSV